MKILNAKIVGYKLCSRGKCAALSTFIKKNKKLNSQLKSVGTEHTQTRIKL